MFAVSSSLACSSLIFTVLALHSRGPCVSEDRQRRKGSSVAVLMTSVVDLRRVRLTNLDAELSYASLTAAVNVLEAMRRQWDFIYEYQFNIGEMVREFFLVPVLPMYQTVSEFFGYKHHQFEKPFDSVPWDYSCKHRTYGARISAWCKIPSIARQFNRGYEWVVHLNGDAFLLPSNLTFADLERVSEPSAGCQNDSEIDVFVGRDYFSGTNINGGVHIWKNTERSRRFLSSWWEEAFHSVWEPGGHLEHNWPAEQGLLNAGLLDPKEPICARTLPPAYLYVPANVSTERCDNADGPFFAFHVTGLGAKFPLIKTCARRLLPQEQADRDAIKNRLLENIVVNPMNFEDSWEWSKHVRPCA